MTDLDPLLREAMASVRGPIDARPSLGDVRRRARRRNRRRMAVTAGVVACAGVATTALIIRRDSPGTAATTGSEPVDSAVTASTRYMPGANETTTTGYGLPTMTITPSSVWDALWNAHNDPSGVAVMVAPPDQDAAQRMPTPEQFGCTTNECRAMFTYVVWHEIARTIGFFDVSSMQAANPGVDFSRPPVEGSVLQTVYSEAVTPTTSSPPRPRSSASTRRRPSSDAIRRRLRQSPWSSTRATSSARQSGGTTCWPRTYRLFRSPRRSTPSLRRSRHACSPWQDPNVRRR